MNVSCHRPFFPGTSLVSAVIPTAQASSFALQYFPYFYHFAHTEQQFTSPVLFLSCTAADKQFENVYCLHASQRPKKKCTKNTSFNC